MNSYDLAAMAAIQDYHDTHSTYPRFIEATADYKEAMGYFYFEFTEPIPNTRDEQHTRVPVIEVGGAHRHVLIRQTSAVSISDACQMVHVIWNGEQTRILAAGCRISTPETHGGLLTGEPWLVYYQISAIVFGHESVLQELASSKSNHLTNER